jgi:hypothetical protein
VDDIKSLPAPSILLKAFGLMHNFSPQPTGANPTSSPVPYQHWETSSGLVTTPDIKVHYPSPLSAIKHLPSEHLIPPATTVPPERVSSLATIAFSSLLPTSYVSTRRSVQDNVDYSVAGELPHQGAVSYSTPSSNVFFQSFVGADSNRVYQDTSFYQDQASSQAPPYEEPLYHHVTHPPAAEGFHNHVSYTPEHELATQETVISQHYEVPTQESAFSHRHSEQKHHEYSALPTPETGIKALPEVLSTIYHHQIQHKPPQTTYHHEPPKTTYHHEAPKTLYHHEPPQAPSYHHEPQHPLPKGFTNDDYHRLLSLMKHHDYNPSLTDTSDIKSLPELLEHLNVYRDPHPKEEEIFSTGLKVKSLPEYAKPPQYNYDGGPIDHVPHGNIAPRAFKFN